MAFSTLVLSLSDAAASAGAPERFAEARSIGANQVRFIAAPDTHVEAAATLVSAACEQGLDWSLDTDGDAALVDALARDPRRRAHALGVRVRSHSFGRDGGDPSRALATLAVAGVHGLDVALRVLLDAESVERLGAIALEAAQLGASGIVFECPMPGEAPPLEAAVLAKLEARIQELDRMMRIVVAAGPSVPTIESQAMCAAYRLDELSVDASDAGRWCERLDGSPLSPPGAALAEIAREAIAFCGAARQTRVEQTAAYAAESPCGACRRALGYDHWPSRVS